MPRAGHQGRVPLRLARQRPRPDRVRLRVSAVEEGSLRLWWRCVDWGKAGTIVGILVGAVGLLLTGVATFYDARVSALQLAQSRDDAEEEARRQAARVASWGDLKARVHVVNRSPEPVSDVEVRFKAGYWEDAPDGINVVREAFRMTLPYLPPCSELVVSGDRLYGGGLAPLDVSFTDSDGVKWIRNQGELARKKTREGSMAAERVQKRWGDGTTLLPEEAMPTVTKVEPCAAVLG